MLQYSVYFSQFTSRTEDAVINYQFYLPIVGCLYNLKRPSLPPALIRQLMVDLSNISSATSDNTYRRFQLVTGLCWCDCWIHYLFDHHLDNLYLLNSSDFAAPPCHLRRESTTGKSVKSLNAYVPSQYFSERRNLCPIASLKDLNHLR